MRILRVRFKNLNSLVGEWELDLTHPAYTGDGIFAITGPTGAGKTTILDAVCLALYGRTPRLNKVTKSGNEIMSRQTGECFAEVTFETQSGSYCCHWSQHRARKKGDGELQAPKHEISHAVSGAIIESNIRGVADQVEKMTGMDFDRFTRSMLLAQGGFAVFLQAAPDERAPILEQITGTEIYSQISIRVHEILRDEREKLNLLQAASAGIEILELEQENDIRQLLETRRKEESELSSRSTETGKAIAWLTTIDGLNREIGNLADEGNKLQRDMEAFKPDREKLSRALSAASLDGVYATLIATRRQQADDKEAWTTLGQALPDLESSVEKQAEALNAAEQNTAQVKEELKIEAPVWQKVRSLDQQLAALKESVAEVERVGRKDAAKINVDTQLRLGEVEKRIKAHEILKEMDCYLKEHAADEWLIGGLAGVEEQLTGLLTQHAEIQQQETVQKKTEKALERATKALDGNQQQTVQCKQALEQASEQLQLSKEVLNQLLRERLLREYRAEKDALLREMAYLTKIAELEDHRAKLEDGKPCPLCGATEHPFAKGNVPVPDAIEKQIDALAGLISKAEDQETTIKQRETAERLAAEKLLEAEKLESAAANDQQAAEKALTEVKDVLVRLRADFAGRRQAVSTKLQPLGVPFIPETDIASLLKTLHDRLKAWQNHVEKKADMERQMSAIDSEIKRLDAVIETQNTVLAEKLARLESFKKDFATVSEERKRLYGDKNPDHEERRLNESISAAESAERQSRERHNDLQQKRNTAKVHIESLKKRMDQREPELKRLETEFSEALVPVEFLDEEQFLKARLSAEIRAKLTVAARDLDDRLTELKARRTDRETRLTMEMARKITDRSLEELEPQFKEQEDALKELRDLIAGLRHKLGENAAAKERIKEKQAAIEAQKKECRRWESLHQLIGSADGKKYRNFAQGLTFELMISHANRQLRTMSDRYLLIRDLVQPLELNVVDNYQAGEIRSTKNLSGGESFIVSLALALGLSHMAGQNVRVDSLFLDEGFGTLDEEALDIALEALAGLPRDGKLIGVISHVPALKERIGAQIQVNSLTGGRSSISGPGCRLLSPEV